MDPDANLAEQRELIRLLGDDGPAMSDADRLYRLERLCDLAEALDEWLSKGGFLPAAWDRKR